MKTTLACRLFFILFFVSIQAQEKMGGLALYTVRDDMAKNVYTTLHTISKIGYRYIEAAGYEEGQFYEMSPTEFCDLLGALELHPMSTHQGTVTFENAEKMMLDVKTVGFEYFVIPVPPMGMFTYDPKHNKMGMKRGNVKLADILTKLGKMAHEAGLKLLYHNHDFEFMPDAEGAIPIDYLLEHCDTKYVNFQMDLLWVTKAGADPLAYFEKYPGRFKSWHVKDMDNTGKFAPVGKGTIDFGRFLAEKEKSGMEFYLVEQDMCFDLEPLNAIQISHKGLIKFGFK